MQRTFRGTLSGRSKHDLEHSVDAMRSLSAERAPGLSAQPLADTVRMEAMATRQHANCTLLFGHTGAISQVLKADTALGLISEPRLFRSPRRPQ